MNHRTTVSASIFALLFLIVARPVHAESYSIPVVGRWSNPQIGLQIPSVPAWARDLVLNASRIWNLAQVWFQRNYFPDGGTYNFFETPTGNVTISFSMPTECQSIAVGWTQYVLAASSTILGAHVFLDGDVFNNTQEPNSTIRMFGLRVVLHELGRVLGLGSLVDGHDIMDPLGTIAHADIPPVISFIDLFALHVLASEQSFFSPVIVSTDQNVSLTPWNLLGSSFGNQVAIQLGDPTAACPVRWDDSLVCYM